LDEFPHKKAGVLLVDNCTKLEATGGDGTLFNIICIVASKCFAMEPRLSSDAIS